MGRNDQNKGKRQQNQLIIVPILLRKQEKHTSCKKQKRNGTVVMSRKSVSQRKDSDDKSQSDHACFKPEIMDDIDPENRKACQKQG